MQRLEVSGAVRPIYGSLGFKRLMGSRNKRIVETSVLSTVQELAIEFCVSANCTFTVHFSVT